MMPQSDARQLARAVRALEPLAEEACSDVQRQLKIAKLALLASLVLSPDSTPPFTKEKHNAFARLQVIINSVSTGDGQTQQVPLFKLTPALVPTVHMASLWAAAGAAARMGGASVIAGSAAAGSAEFADSAAAGLGGAPAVEAAMVAEETRVALIQANGAAAGVGDAPGTGSGAAEVGSATVSAGAAAAGAQSAGAKAGVGVAGSKGGDALASHSAAAGVASVTDSAAKTVASAAGRLPDAPSFAEAGACCAEADPCFAAGGLTRESREEQRRRAESDLSEMLERGKRAASEGAAKAAAAAIAEAGSSAAASGLSQGSLRRRAEADLLETLGREERALASARARKAPAAAAADRRKAADAAGMGAGVAAGALSPEAVRRDAEADFFKMLEKEERAAAGARGRKAAAAAADAGKAAAAAKTGRSAESLRRKAEPDLLNMLEREERAAACFGARKTGGSVALSPEALRRKAESDLFKLLEKEERAAAGASARKAAAAGRRRGQQTPQQPGGASGGRRAAASDCVTGGDSSGDAGGGSQGDVGAGGIVEESLKELSRAPRQPHRASDGRLATRGYHGDSQRGVGGDRLVGESLEELILAPSTEIDASELEGGGWVSVGAGRTRRSAFTHKRERGRAESPTRHPTTNGNGARERVKSTACVDRNVEEGNTGMAAVSVGEHRTAAGRAMETGGPKNVEMFSEGAGPQQPVITAAPALAEEVHVAGESSAQIPEGERSRVELLPEASATQAMAPGRGGERLPEVTSGPEMEPIMPEGPIPEGEPRQERQGIPESILGMEPIPEVDAEMGSVSGVELVPEGGSIPVVEFIPGAECILWVESISEVEQLRALLMEERERHADEVATLRLEYDAALVKAGERIQALRLRLFILEATEEDGGVDTPKLALDG